MSAAATLSTTCSATTTVIEIRVAARRRDALWPVLEALLDPTLDDAVARLHLADLAEARRALRRDDARRGAAFAAFALYGEHGLDANLPTDAVVSRAEPAVLRGALTRSLSFAPDILIEGPAASAVATELVTRMPAPAGAHGRAATLLRPRTLTETTVFVMDAPDRELAELRVAQAIDARAPATRLVAEALGAEPTSGLAEDLGAVLHGTHVKPGSFDARAIFGPEFVRGDARDVPALAAALLAARRLPPSMSAIELAKHALDGHFRSRRRFGMEAAAYVWSWSKVGDTDVDPALAEWMTLRSLDAATARELHAAIAAAPAIVSVIADLRTVDLDALAQLGEVIRVEPEALRDPDLSDSALLSDPVAR